MKSTTVMTENVAELQNRIVELEALVKYYEEQFRLSKHRQFGSSSEKSEYDFGQLSIFNEAEITTDENIAESELIEIEKHYRKAKRSADDRLPEDLPVEIIEYDLPIEKQSCPECGGTLHVMGRETRKELKIIPAQVKVLEHVCKVYACRSCEKKNEHTPIVKADMPASVIKGSFASPEAVAHIMTQKFVMGIPLYRQEQEFLRDGILLSRQTMSNWLMRCAEDWLEPIYERMKACLLKSKVLHADETTLQVLHEPGKTTQSKSYMWLYRTSGDTDRPIVLYEYQPDRRAIRPVEFLRDFKGYLHTDGYDVYHKLPEDIVTVGCWSHVRRKFDEALKVLPEKDRDGSGALRGKRYCDRLFEIERELSSLAPDERYRERQNISKPLIEEFFAWINSLAAVPKTGLGKAAYYALSQRKYLERYLLDGRLEISNNRAERSIKPFVIGRKNWLFANTVKGARVSAMIYSIIETAKENGLNPFTYLAYLLRAAPNLDIPNNCEAVDKLLPWTAPDSCKIARRQ